MNRNYAGFLLTFILQCILIRGVGYAQTQTRDSLKISLAAAEALFLQQNLDLIAQRYNIDAARAEIITAGLFENPQVSFENILWNPETKRTFDFSKTGGQYTTAISQLIVTAGKRNKNIQLAKLGVQQSEYQFYDLLRTLRYTLRNDYYKIHFQEQSITVYRNEINSLAKTLQVFETQYSKGNIAEKEILRIKSQLYSLQAELNDLQDVMEDVQSELKLLIRSDPKDYILTVLPFDPTGKKILENIPYTRLLDSARVNRYDLKIARTGIDYANINYQLQRALSVPDLTIALTYDKQGSNVNNYTGLGISVPLPLLNRNQGNIRQAKIAIDAGKTQLQKQEDLLESELSNAYESALRLENLYNGFDPGFRGDFDHLIGEVFKNYEKRNISLLEFLDFYDSYKTNTIQLNNLQLNRINSLEQLNYVTGSSFFNS